MSKHKRPFVFKQFEVEHCRSSMKVGIDAVVLGAWADVPLDAKKVLDVGCGCGVISLMLAQRFDNVRVLGIDVDKESVEESTLNFKSSPWKDRLEARVEDFNSIEGPFDYIISNPPYFEDGIKEIDTARLSARHQGSLNPTVVIKKGAGLLKENGRIGLVCPFSQLEELLGNAEGVYIKPIRIMLMAGNPGLEFKRCFIEFERAEEGWDYEKQEDYIDSITEELYVETENGEFSGKYRELCKEFYLKF